MAEEPDQFADLPADGIARGVFDWDKDQRAWIGAIVIKSAGGRITICCAAQREHRRDIIEWLNETLADRSWEQEL